MWACWFASAGVAESRVLARGWAVLVLSGGAERVQAGVDEVVPGPVAWVSSSASGVWMMRLATARMRNRNLASRGSLVAPTDSPVVRFLEQTAS